MANAPEDPKPQGNASQETATLPTGVATAPADAPPQTPAPTNGAASPTPDTAVAAGPAPQVAFTPDSTAVTAAPRQPAPAEQEALIGSWLAAHVHKADIPYLLVVIVLAFLLGSFSAANADIWHHLATGRLLSEGTYNPVNAEDPFGTGPAGADGGLRHARWINHSWLFAWVSYLLYSESNRGAVLVVLKALCCAALACVLLAIRPRNRHGWAGTLCVLLGVLALSPVGFLLNPIVISMLFLGLTMLILHRAGVLVQTGEPGRPMLLWWLPPLFAVWVNLDGWFIFGPITVACCLAGLLLDAGLGKKPHFSIARLSQVLGVGLLACLLNPYHIWGLLQMPLELSYLLVRLGNFWPDSMVAGGRCMVVLQKGSLQGAAYLPTLSPVSSPFWSQQTLGLSVAGISFFVLLALVAFSFYLCQKANPAMLMVRSVPAALCGVLALLLVRFIPLFAVVGTVVALLNIQEYLAWREVTYPAKVEEQDLWANMTRLIMGFVYFGLLLLAWPGWLNNPIGDFASSRRVAWSIDVDPSLEKTARFLKEKNDNGELKRVLNIDRSIASYCAWLAPELHFFIDHRMQLFDREAGFYVEMQDNLLREYYLRVENRNNRWRDHFRQFGMDSLVSPTPTQLNSQGQLSPYTSFFLTAMVEPASELVPIYGDGKTAVMAWKKAFQKPMPGLDRQWRAEAFGQHEAAWPDEIPLPEDLGFWGLYFQGLPQPRLAAQQARLEQLYLQTKGKYNASVWRDRSLVLWEVTRFGMPNNLCIGPLVLLLNQSFAIVPPQGERKEPIFGDLRSVHLTDQGPPEAALLGLKSARKAVVEDTYDPFSHRTFTEMIAIIDTVQESHWANAVSPVDFRLYAPGANLRSSLRKFQRIASMQRYAKLKPQDPQIQYELFVYFKNEGCWDMALEHLQYLAEYLDSSNQMKKQAEEEKKQYKSAVEMRLTRLELDRQPKDSMVDMARKAFWAPFPTTGKDGKAGPGEPLGLMKKALDLLHEYKPGEKNDAQQFELQGAILMLFDLNLRMGNLWELKSLALNEKGDGESDFFKNHPDRNKFKFYYYGVTGDYARADKALEDWDRTQTDLEKAGKVDDSDKARFDFERARKTEAIARVFQHSLTLSMPQPNYLCAYPYYFPYPMQAYEIMVNTMELARAERLTMRGILAIEVGNTAAALTHFKAALDLAGPNRWFVDRGVAERYKTLLEINRGK